MVVCLERGADLHMAQLMPLLLTVSHILVLPFWYRPTWVVPDKGLLNGCVSASVKSRLVLPCWYRLTRVVLDKGPLNGCVVRVINNLITISRAWCTKRQITVETEWKHVLMQSTITNFSGQNNFFHDNLVNI